MSNEIKYATCGAKTRTGHPCKLPAGHGTNHLGSGRCKFHGGASAGAPGKNLYAERHGFYTKHLPEESLEILQDVSSFSPIDMLWDSIMLQWAAIIRAQKLMYVKDQHGHTRTKVGYSDGKVIGEKWEVQHAWDKQEQFLNAQSRAMTTLGQQIERYDKLCKSELATEEQRARIEKLKMEIEVMKGGQDALDKLDEVLEGINHVASE